ncbi:MAG: hypothetical protein EOO61_03145 [Hymenobacter sp.]|nr:MAG: hypothetical protein EOO61_03145 [Hymenobacter sp.]
MPTSAIDTLIRSGFAEASSVQLVQVRQGRQINLPWLVALVKVGLPDFEIPEQWLPTTPVAATTPLFQPS